MGPAGIFLFLLFFSQGYDNHDSIQCPRKNNLPRGLLPNGVKSYTLNPEGKFEVTLPRECDFPLTYGGQEFKFRFATTVGGVIKSGSIHEVYGVSVQIKFGWLGLRQVDRAGDQLTLQVQQFLQSFPVSAFSVSPSCS